MKRISFLLLVLTLCAVAARAQDAATEQRLEQLSGKIDGLQESEQALRKAIAELNRQLASLSDKVDKPTGNYASASDLKALAAALKEVDEKRVKDTDTVHKELEKLRDDIMAALKKAPATTASGGRTGSGSPPASATRENPAQDGPGAWYEIKEGDTISAIVAAYRQHNPPIKVTQEQILRANPTVEPSGKNLRIGQKLWIPLPASTP